MKRIGVIGVTCAATLALGGTAYAAKDTYAGNVKGTPEGKIALDVKIDKRGFVRKITEFRGSSVPSNCAISGPIPGVSFQYPGKVRVDQETAKFSATYTQPTYGNVSSLSGTLFGRTMKGKFRINHHYPPFESLPEEDCDTGTLKFKASLDNLDEVVVTPPARLVY